MKIIRGSNPQVVRIHNGCQIGSCGPPILHANQSPILPTKPPISNIPGPSSSHSMPTIPQIFFLIQPILSKSLFCSQTNNLYRLTTYDSNTHGVTKSTTVSTFVYLKKNKSRRKSIYNPHRSFSNGFKNSFTYDFV